MAEQIKTIRVLLSCAPEVGNIPNQAQDGGFRFSIVGREETVEKIVASFAQGHADIVLIDADRVNFDAFSITNQITVDYPDAMVILISESHDPDSLRRAMLAGAEEYLIKPLDQEAVLEALVSVSEIMMQKRQAARVVEEKEAPQDEIGGKIIGLLSGKGGLGKTTLAVNLALALVRDTKKRVALVGMEAGDATILLNVRPRGALAELAGQSEFDSELLEQYGVLHPSGLTLFCANMGAAVSETRFVASNVARRVLEMLKSSRDYVLLDFPNLIDQQELQMTEMLDQALVICSSSDLLVLRNTKSFIDLLSDNVRERVSIVLNGSERSDMIQMDDITRTLQREVAMTIQRDRTLAVSAINTGSPFVLTHPQVPVSRDIATLARIVAGEEGDSAGAQSQKKRFLFFS